MTDESTTWYVAECSCGAASSETPHESVAESWAAEHGDGANHTVTVEPVVEDP